jgi:yecA family protein
MNKSIFSNLKANQKEMLANFLKRGEKPDTIKTIPELEGFLYGITITSDILPNEWLTEVVADRVIENEEEKALIVGMILNAYHHLLEDFNAGRLKFPFKITPKNLTDEFEKIIQQWCKGFYYALHLRPKIWKLEYMEEDAKPPDELMPYMLNLQIISNIVFAEELPEIYEDITKNPNDIDAVLALSYVRLEEAINFFIAYAKSLKKDDFDQIHSEEDVRKEPKIGRNDPCLCGSGKKYKKCCGKN